MGRDTIMDRFVRRTRENADQPAMWYLDGTTWRHITWTDYGSRVRNFAAGLLAAGLEEAGAVAIMANNCPEWLIANQAAMMVRGVGTGIYQTSTVSQILYITNHCEARVLVLENEDMFRTLEPEIEALEFTEKIVMIRDADRIDHEKVISFEDFSATGEDQLEAVEARFSEIEGSDLATLIYTSGTTGPPKGVMLSHDNLSWTAGQAIQAVGQVAEEDCIVSYLPLSHIAEQMFSIHLSITAGYPIWFAQEVAKVRDAIATARPTLFLGVPRVWEKFHAAVDAKLQEATGVKARIVEWARAVGLEAGHIIIEEGESALPFALKIQYQLADKLFYSKLKAGLGLDRLKVGVTGAAPISKSTLEFFLSCGVIIHEVYGQSEGSGPTTFNFPEPGKRRLGTVGKKFPGVEVELRRYEEMDDDQPGGEICVKGQNVFMGYFKDPDATAATLKDGWLYSGDVGTWDADGFLRITDRRKDLIITSGGKNVAPQNIEKLLKSIDGIGQAVVIGDQRKFLSALLTIDADRGPTFAAERGWPADPEALAAHKPFQDYVEKGVNGVNAKLGGQHETIKKYAVLPIDFTIEGGELTPTQKVRRKVVSDKYESMIDGFYLEE